MVKLDKTILEDLLISEGTGMVIIPAELFKIMEQQEPGSILHQYVLEKMRQKYGS